MQMIFVGKGHKSKSYEPFVPYRILRHFKKYNLGTFLVVQWLRICLPMNAGYPGSIPGQKAKSLQATKRLCPQVERGLPAAAKNPARPSKEEIRHVAPRGRLNV